MSDPGRVTFTKDIAELGYAKKILRNEPSTSPPVKQNLFLSTADQTQKIWHMNQRTMSEPEDLSSKGDMVKALEIKRTIADLYDIL